MNLFKGLGKLFKKDKKGEEDKFKKAKDMITLSEAKVKVDKIKKATDENQEIKKDKKDEDMKNTNNTNNTINTINTVNTNNTNNVNVVTVKDVVKETKKTENWWDSWKKNYVVSDPAKRPTKIDDNQTLNVVFFKQSILNTIMRKCLPKAGGSEFQFHYRALQVVIKNNEGNRIVFTIPTIFFNFDQEVSGATVDFDLRKVTEISNQIKPISQQLAKAHIQKLKPVINSFKEKGFEVKYIEEEIGSIHRHPGRFGFSATDLDDNPKSPGVIYRNKKAVDLIQTDSVLYCGVDAELYTTETRVFNIQPVDENDEDKGVEGTVATAKTLCYILQDEINEGEDIFASFFDEPVQENSTKWLVHSYKEAKEYKEIKKLFEDFMKNYNPADAVNPDLIKQKVYAYQQYGFNYGNYNKAGSYTYTSKGSNKRSLKDAKEEVSMELKIWEPVNHTDIEFVKEYLKDPETVASLKDIYDYYKNKKNKLVIQYKGGVQIIMNESGGKLVFKGKDVWTWDWSIADDDVTYEDLYRGGF